MGIEWQVCAACGFGRGEGSVKIVGETCHSVHVDTSVAESENGWRITFLKVKAHFQQACREGHAIKVSA